MTLYAPSIARRKAVRARFVVGAFLGILLVSLFRAQVLRSEDWALQSESNRLRSLTEPAPRGIIRDRNGRVIADNVPGYSVSILPAEPDSMIATLDRLSAHMEISEARRRSFEATAQARPGRPVLLSVSVPFDVVSAIEERRTGFPEGADRFAAA